jgi:hypothetical protein
MNGPNCFRACTRQRRPLQQVAKVDWLTSGRGVYAYDLSSASARADCASLRFLSRQIVDVSLEQPLKVLTSVERQVLIDATNPFVEYRPLSFATVN